PWPSGSRTRRLARSGRQLPLELAGLPQGGRHDRTLDHAVRVTADDPEHRADELLAEEVRSQAEIAKLGVGGVVVVALGFDARVGIALYLNVDSDLGRTSRDELGQLR